MYQLNILIFLFLCIEYVKSTTLIQLIYFSTGNNDDYIDYIIDEYNNYSQINNLDVTLVKNTYSTVISKDSYSDTIEYLLNVKSIKFDLIFLDTIDSKNFANHLVDLNNYLSESTIEKYKYGLTNETYIIDNKIVSMPLYLEYDMLYSNQDYLDKYDKPIPTTWNELIDTAKFIISEEEKIGNEIVGYSSDIQDSDGFCSLYEYIFSYRNTTEDSFPVITNPEVEDAMKMLKLMKDELGVYGMRTSNNDISKCLNSTNCLFIKAQNHLSYQGNYTLTNIPGRIEGLSGTVLGGYNLGINNYISEDRKKKVASILEYIASEELKKSIAMDFGFQSAIKDVYENDEVCLRYEQCIYFRGIQPVILPIHETDNYKEYFVKFKSYLLKYLFYNLDLSYCLSSIKYITKVYEVKNNSILDQHYKGIIGFTDVVLIFCYCLSLTKKHRYKFRFLNHFYWFLYMCGIIIIISYGFTGMGQLNKFKCRIRPVVFSVGFTMSNTVIIIRLLTNFPESERHFSHFCRNHSGIALLISFSLDAILNILSFIKPTLVDVYTEGEYMFYTCKINGTLNSLALFLIYFYKLLILLGIAVLLFVEWNIEDFKYDVRNTLATLFISIIAFVLFVTVESIKMTGFKEKFIIPAMIIYIYGVTCFTTFFIIRFFSKFRDDEESEEAIIKKAQQFNHSDNTMKQPRSWEKYTSSMSINNSSNTNSLTPQKKTSIVDHLISLHNYGNEIKKSSDALRNSTCSSSTNLSGTRVNIRRNSYGASLDNIKNYDDSMTMMARRASQITAIPENKIAETYNSATTSTSNESSSDDHIPRSRTRSCEGFNPGVTRTQRINSTPNKKFLGLDGIVRKRSYDNFPNNMIYRKGSCVSFSNIQPMNASSYTNINNPSRKCSAVTASISNSMNSFSTGKQSQNDIPTSSNRNISTSNINVSIAESINENNNPGISSSNNNINNNNEQHNIKYDMTMASVNPSVFTTSSFKSANGDGDEI